MGTLRAFTTAALLLGSASPALAEVPLSTFVPISSRPGHTVKVVVKTDPRAKCMVKFQDSGLTQVFNLPEKSANRFGKATFKFRLPDDFKADKMPLIIIADEHGEQSKLIRTVGILR